ncbi:unnamed protein product, partial [Prorocentrum cordatum]
GSWVVVTPERDIYLEDLQDGIESLVPLGPMGGPPSGWRRGPTHMFWGSPQGPLHQAESLRLQAEGAELAEQERRDHGLGAARPAPLPAGAPPPLALEGDPATDEGEWRFSDSRGEARLGERVGAAELEAGCRRGDRGVAQLRTLPARYEKASQRYRSNKEAASLTATTAFDDWPISGPRTAEWLAREIARQGLESLSRLFEYALTYDRLNFGKYVGLAGGDSGHLDNDRLYMGEEGRHGRAPVAPALETWISQKLSGESAVLKGRRKAMEERQLPFNAGLCSACTDGAAKADELDIAMGHILSRYPSKFAEFLNSAYESGVVEPAAEVRNFVGVFLVRKKGGSLRIIFDPRKTDAQFAPPDGVALASPEALGDLKLPASRKLWVSEGGVENCYYQFLLPVDLCADFALPAVPRRALPRRLRDLFPAGSELVHFQVRVAPMGWSWAAALVQASNAELLRSGPLGARRWLCNRRCAPAVAGREHAALLRIDNFASLGTAKEAVQVDGDSMGRQLRGRGLATHDVSGPQVDVDLLGFHADGGKGAIHIAPERFWRLALSLDYISTRPFLTGAGPGWRGTWAPSAMAVDAPLTGLGAAECAATPAEVGRNGRVRERWRFKGRDLVAEGSRARALREGAVGGSAFPDVPADFCKSSLWKTVASRRWRHKAPIHLLGGEALLWAMRRQVRRVAHHGCRLLFLSDSMCICCAVAKGTAAEPPAATALPWHRLLGSNVSGLELETEAADAAELPALAPWPLPLAGCAARQGVEAAVGDVVGEAGAGATPAGGAAAEQPSAAGLEAQATSFTFHCCRRPGELLATKAFQPVAPAHGRRSGFRWWALLLHPEELLVPIKTGEQGDSLPLDAPELLLRAEFEESLAALGLRGLGATLPGSRRGGASPDRVAGRRSQEEVTKRGRGQARLSVRRRERHGRPALPVAKAPPVVQQQLRLGTRRLPSLSGLSSTQRSTEFAWAENESPSRHTLHVVLNGS